MAVYAYLRVSTDRQDVDNQRYGVLFAEVSRMARSTLQVLEMLACCMQRGVHTCILPNSKRSIYSNLSRVKTA